MTTLPLRKLGAVLALVGALPLLAVAQTPPPSDPVSDYISEVQMILQRDFMVPASIPQSEREGLRVGVSVIIGPNRRFRSIEIADRSGNATFDQAVETHIAALLRASPRLPEPPRAARSRFVGVPLPVSFVPPPPRAAAPSEGAPTAAP